MTSTKRALLVEPTAGLLAGTPQQAQQFLAAFELPPGLEATGPAEAEGRARDSVKLLVASSEQGVRHTTFDNLDQQLDEGDLLVVNRSATLPAALPAVWRGQEFRLHLSSPLQDSLTRLVEFRRPWGHTSSQLLEELPGAVFELPAGGSIELVGDRPGARLKEGRLSLPDPLERYVSRWGQPIRYSYSASAWPIQYYQTIFGNQPGSSEMPSAGRPFSPHLLAKLAGRGIRSAAITLHCGVASLESHEPPYAEPFEVPAETARLVNQTHTEGHRVLAVGTTVVRALETVSDLQGEVREGRGFTDLVITPDRGVACVDGIISGWHEPKATHLMMLEAIAGPQVLAASYQSALDHGYLWHEFGDSHLILR